MTGTRLASDLDLVVILQELFQVGVGDLLSFRHYDGIGLVASGISDYKLGARVSSRGGVKG
jgi:hypothetical protein